MAVRIVTDSTCDLPTEIAAQRAASIVVPNLHEHRRQELPGRRGINHAVRSSTIGCRRSSPAPTTAAPGIGVFLQAFEQAASEGATGIVSIHPPSELSSLYSVAELAAREMRSLPIAVVDCRQVTLGMGSVVLAAARMAAAGCTVDEIAAALPDVIRRTYVFGVLDTVEYLRRGGRASRLQSGLSALLQMQARAHGVRWGDHI